MTPHFPLNRNQTRYNINGFTAFNHTDIARRFMIDSTEFKFCDRFTCQQDGIDPFFRRGTRMGIFAINSEFKAVR